MSTRPTMVLSGGSGVLGQRLIDYFADTYRLVCLTGKRQLNDPRVDLQYRINLRLPDLGLSGEIRDAITGDAAVILHAAASTNWRLDPSEIYETNTIGARAVAGLARDAGVRLLFFSTAFVHDPPDDARFPGAAAYVRSKVAAEALVHESGCFGDILRPSIIVGDSLTGEISAFQGFHTVLGGLLRDRLPAIPCPPGAPVDFICLDTVCAAIDAVLRTPADPDHVRDHWLTSGGSATSARDVLDLIYEHAARCGLPATSARFIAPDSVERLIIPLLEGQVPEPVRDQLRELLEFLWLFQSSHEFPSDLAHLGLDAHLTNEFVNEAVRSNLRFLAESKGLCRHEPQAV